jgi:hypothetical protein
MTIRQMSKYGQSVLNPGSQPLPGATTERVNLNSDTAFAFQKSFYGIEV